MSISPLVPTAGDDECEEGAGDRPIRRIRLTTIDDVAAEIARVYRDARSNKIKTSDASRLVFILTMLAKVKQGDIERRLEILEQLLEQQGAKV